MIAVSRTAPATMPTSSPAGAGAGAGHTELADAGDPTAPGGLLDPRAGDRHPGRQRTPADASAQVVRCQAVCGPWQTIRDRQHPVPNATRAPKTSQPCQVDQRSKTRKQRPTLDIEATFCD